MSELPTVEQCREFLDTINHGRALIDLPPLDVLDFDGAQPDHTSNCLSARNLFAHAGYGVLSSIIEESVGPELDNRVRRVLDDDGRIPSAITVITDLFDMCGYDGTVTAHGDHAALRARLVEAGVVAL